jgi:hypothetical protein
LAPKGLNARRLRTARADLVRDDAAKLALAEKDRAIAAAVYRYSEDKPQDKVQDVTPASANLLPLPAAWEDGFSTLRSLEYPIGNVPPTLPRPGRYRFYRRRHGEEDPDLDAVQVAAANTVRITFTIKHVSRGRRHHTGAAPRAGGVLGGAICCDQLAAFYSAAGLDHPGGQRAAAVEGAEYSKRAKELRKRYLDELGIEDKRSAPAGTIVEAKQTDSWGGARINHPAIVRY